MSQPQNTQEEQPPQQVAAYYVQYLAKRNQITNLEKQLGLAEEEMIGVILQEIDRKNKFIQSMQEAMKKMQPIPQEDPVEKLDKVTEQVPTAPPGKELPGRPATQKEIKKAEIVPPQTPPPTQK